MPLALNYLLFGRIHQHLLEVRRGQAGSLLETLDEVTGIAKSGQLGYLGNFIVGVFQQGHCVINSNLIQIIVEINTGFLFKQKSEIGSIDVVLITEILDRYILGKIFGHILHSQQANGA